MPPPRYSEGGPEAALWIGPTLDFLPIGSIELAAMGRSASQDAASAVGLGGLLDYRLPPYFSVGFAPRIITPVKVDGATDSGSQLDLRARGTAGGDVTPRVHLQGVLTLGYSWIFHLAQDTNTGDYHTSKGVIFGFGAGVVWAINPRLLLVGEMTYQLGYQGLTIQGFDVDVNDSYLTLGAGILFPLK